MQCRRPLWLFKYGFCIPFLNHIDWMGLANGRLWQKLWSFGFILSATAFEPIFLFAHCQQNSHKLCGFWTLHTHITSHHTKQFDFISAIVGSDVFGSDLFAVGIFFNISFQLIVMFPSTTGFVSFRVCKRLHWWVDDAHYCMKCVQLFLICHRCNLYIKKWVFHIQNEFSLIDLVLH